MKSCMTTEKHLDLGKTDKGEIVRRDSRLSRMLHVLIHMAEHDEPLTSEAVAGFMSTNPVVARRTMAGLRDAGFLTSKKGHGGGWALAVPLEQITLLDVYRALGDPAVFAFGPTGEPADCLVEQAIDERLEATLEEARALCYQGKYVEETVLSTSSAVWLVASAPVSAEARVAKPQTFKSFLFR
jgi:DNA-binding IscR family transcriptional regulator